MMLTVEDGVNGTGGRSGVGSVGWGGGDILMMMGMVCVLGGGEAGGKGIDGEVGTTVVESKSQVDIVVGTV